MPFQAVYPDMSLVSSSDSFFATVKSQYPEYFKSGFFKKAAQDGIYVCSISNKVGDYVGIIAAGHIKDFLEGRVLKHEDTIASKEQQMMHLVLQNRAMVKPILLAYEGVKEIDSLLHTVMKGEPFLSIDFEESGEHHQLWAINDGNTLQRLQALFEQKVKRSYIADGHHRSSTSLSLYQTDHHVYDKESVKGVLCIYFPFRELRIYDYNRVVEAFQEVNPVKFVVMLSKYCKIKPINGEAKPGKKHTMTMLLQKQWYRLRWKKSVLKAARRSKAVTLDAELFNTYVLGSLLDITNVREDPRLTYVDGVSGLTGVTAEVSKHKNRVGFCLYPVSKEELKKAADHDQVLPPKSTWFEPRVKNGMIVKEL